MQVFIKSSKGKCDVVLSAVGIQPGNIDSEETGIVVDLKIVVDECAIGDGIMLFLHSSNIFKKNK